MEVDQGTNTHTRPAAKKWTVRSVLEAASVSAKIGQASRSAVQEETKGEAREKGPVAVGGLGRRIRGTADDGMVWGKRRARGPRREGPLMEAKAPCDEEQRLWVEPHPALGKLQRL